MPTPEIIYKGKAKMEDYNEEVYNRALQFLHEVKNKMVNFDPEWHLEDSIKRHGLYGAPYKNIKGAECATDYQLTVRAKSIAKFFAERGRKGAAARKKSITPDLLTSFSNQELLEELKRRGYTGTLSLKVEL